MQLEVPHAPEVVLQALVPATEPEHQQQAHAAGASTALNFAAQSTNPGELRAQVRTELTRVQTYMESMVTAMTSIEEAHRTATETPVPPESPRAA